MLQPPAQPRPPIRHTVRARRRPLAAVLALSLVLAVLATGCASTNQAKMAGMVNASRRAHGLHSLASDGRAMAKAQAWAAHMASTGRVEHSGGGSRLSTAGLPRWCSVGENVGKATSTAHVESLWMASSAHRANIMGSYNRIGTGVVRKGQYVYAVQIFYRSC